MKKIIISILIVLVFLLGISYAWFNYVRVGETQRIITGSLYLVLKDKTDAFSLRNVYPLSVEEARARDDNLMTFSVSGKNTSSSDNIHYEIMLKNGDDMESPYVRLNPEHLVFDLIEVGENGEETYLLDAVSFPSVDGRRIWVDTVLHGTNENIERTYKLRMWVSDKVLISDSDPNADYTAHMGTSTDFKNHYASIKIAVQGDMKEKSLPLSIKTSDTFVENGKSYFLGSITNDYLLEDEGKSLDSQDVVEVTITNPENKLLFSYTDGGDVSSTSETIVLTYNYLVNRKYNVKVFLESKNDSNVETNLNFVVRKNGEFVQEFVKKVSVIGNNYCLNNGFAKLSDCILVTENLSKSVNDAKTYIASKGEPDVNNTAPSITYDYTIDSEVTENAISISNSKMWTFLDNLVFDSKTGYFKMSNYTFDYNLSENYINYYTCGEYTTSCNTIYKIASVHLDTNSVDAYIIQSYELSSIESEVGLYQVGEGENTNKYSYIFRGNVNNNNVKFGGYDWKVVRINDDGTIRIILNQSMGNGFNLLNNGPTYVGYMYNESTIPTTSDSTYYSQFNKNTKYYWGDDYSYDVDANGITRFKLKSSNYPLISLTTDDMKTAKGTNTSGEEVLQLSLTPYTCKSTSSDGTCTGLFHVNSINTSTAGNANYITMSPESKELAQTNGKDSNAKKLLDDWYVKSFSTKLNNGKNVTTYLADEVFCNDRSTIVEGNYNSGYLLSAHTYYAGQARLRDATNRYASLSCISKNDSFTVNETQNTNGMLTYPIGLLTADEVALAGGRFGSNNEKFYLKSGEYYYSMTPLHYYSTGMNAEIFGITNKGQLKEANANGSWRLRPVINLNADVTIMQGDGTPTNPYIIE